MWRKGYCHYHTGFRYPEGQRITPEKLAEDLAGVGASFAFCAGDHGDNEGNNYWGMQSKEYRDYRAACLSADKIAGVVLIPVPEIHLRFPAFDERHEHHTCLPIVDYVPELNPPKAMGHFSARALGCSYIENVAGFIDDAHRRGMALPLNHPWASVNTLFGAPFPLSVPCLYQMDYIELSSIDHLYRPGEFAYNLNLYFKFLAYPDSAMMACCDGVDNALTPWRTPSAEKRIMPCTYLYIPGDVTLKAVMEAWNARQSCAAYGDLCLESIAPIPSKNRVMGGAPPSVSLRLGNSRKVPAVRIYRNGIKVYDETLDRETLDWEDKNARAGDNHYVVHVKSGEEHLVTSPINYLVER